MRALVSATGPLAVAATHRANSGSQVCPTANDTSRICIAQPTSLAQNAAADSHWDFIQSPVFAEAATQAQRPSGYSIAFLNKKASTSSTSSSDYLGHFEFATYDTQKCAARCDTTESCSGFNLYFERTPSQILGPTCRTAPPATVIKCALWAKELQEDTLTNSGSTTWDFKVVMAGSNGYNKEMPKTSKASRLPKYEWRGSVLDYGTFYFFVAVLVIYCLVLFALYHKEAIRRWYGRTRMPWQRRLSGHARK
ncbi:hypothetical protein ACN47E_006114 [Coniothyrium glycines]